jgi:hypothetical protein
MAPTSTTWRKRQNGAVAFHTRLRLHGRAAATPISAADKKKAARGKDRAASYFVLKWLGHNQRVEKVFRSKESSR